MTSGSSRAFDRRPLEAATIETQPLADVATSSAYNTIMEARTSSPDTSYSGEDHAHDPPESTGATTDLKILDYLEPPLFNWEELNWP